MFLYNRRWPEFRSGACTENMNEAVTETRSLRVDSALHRSIDESDLTWRVLGTLNVFRVLLALVLIFLFLPETNGKELEETASMGH